MTKRIISHRHVISPKLKQVRTLAVVTDLHNGAYADVLDTLRTADAVLIVGDLLNRHRHGFANAAQFLLDAPACAPTYYAIGNHEWKSPDRPEFWPLVEKSAVTVLDNDLLRMDDIILGALSSQPKEAIDAGIVERMAQEDGFRLLLCHHPEWYPRFVQGHGIDLTLAVGTADQLKCLIQTQGELEVIHMTGVVCPHLGCQSLQLLVQSLALTACTQMTVEILLSHGSGTGHQIAQHIGKIHIDGVDQQLIGEVAVGAEGEGPQQEETQGIHTEPLAQQIGIHHIATGLTHLLTVEVQPAVTVDLLGQGQVQAHEHSGPDDGMEPDDLLTHEMNIRRPEVVQIIVLVILELLSSD